MPWCCMMPVKPAQRTMGCRLLMASCTSLVHRLITSALAPACRGGGEGEGTRQVRLGESAACAHGQGMDPACMGSQGDTSGG